MLVLIPYFPRYFRTKKASITQAIHENKNTEDSKEKEKACGYKKRKQE